MRALAGAAAALVVACSFVIATASPAAATNGAGSCDPYIDGTVIPVPCSSGGSAGGAAGSPGGTTTSSTCTFTTLDEAQVENLGLSWPPPRGKHWALMVCGGAEDTGPQVFLVGNGPSAPPVTPQQLLVVALGELRLPYLQPATAPPRGTDGLVGLPEWFWVPPGQWRARSVTVTAGPVWATATAAPVGLTFQPGAGLDQVTCPGPGSAYNRRKPAAEQRTDCSYTYLQPSVGLPANAYRASVTVTWRITWTGSGGAGGLLDGSLAVPVSLTIAVAQGEALVTSQ
jgi:hypothetical protein